MKDCFGAPAGLAIAPTSAFGYLLTARRVFWWASRAGNQRLGRDAARRGLASFRSALTAVRRRACARRPADRHALPAGAGRAGLRRLRHGGDRRRSPGDIRRRRRLLRPYRRQRRAGAARPCNHCDDQCPLCRSIAEAAAFVPPDAPTLPLRVNAGRVAIRAAPDFGAFSACPAQRNRARAPPLAV